MELYLSEQPHFNCYVPYYSRALETFPALITLVLINYYNFILYTYNLITITYCYYSLKNRRAPNCTCSARTETCPLSSTTTTTTNEQQQHLRRLRLQQVLGAPPVAS